MIVFSYLAIIEEHFEHKLLLVISNGLYLNVFFLVFPSALTLGI